MQERFKEWKSPLFDEDGYAYPNHWVNKHTPKVHYINPYGWRCQYHENLKLGKNVDIGCFTYMNAKYGIEIGDNVQIGAHCAIYSDNTENQTHGSVNIGEGSLIGSYTLILPNVTIEPGSKIKARSILK